MGVNGIYGLSGSGMDIESMVKVGMLSKQSEYDKMAQKYTKNEWMKADYLELSNQITTFNASTLSQYKMSTTMNAKSAESSSSAVKVSANSSASNVTHRVEVTGLSTNAYVVSTTKPTRYNSTNNAELKGMLFQNLRAEGTDKISGTTADGIAFTADKTAKAIEFTVAGKDGGDTKTISLTYEDILNGATINDISTQINQSGLNLKAEYDVDHDIFSIYNKSNGADNKLSISVTGKDEYTITKTTEVTKRIDGTWNTWTQQYDYDTTNAYNEVRGATSQSTTYQSVAGRTTAKFLNSWGFYQSKDGDLYDPNTTNTLKSNTTEPWTFGAGVKGTTIEQDHITYQKYQPNYLGSGSTPAGTIDGGLNQKSSYLSNNTSGSTKSISGENSTMKIDGVVYDDIKDNKITINGVTYTAVDRTNGTSAVISITQDTDAIVDKVKSFVADYNKLLSSLYEKYDEKPNSDYKPLTQSQKDAMKEEQITKWEEKAKAGLLYHDQTIGKIIQKMRSAITDSVEQDDGSTASVFSLGISTTGLKGQLVLDEDKLRKALDKDPDIVYNVLSKPDLDVASKNGVAQKLGDIFTDATKSIKSRAGSTADITEDSDLNNLLRQLQTRMSNFKKMMATYENALYKKYDAMEATLAKLGTQLNFVMGGNA